MDKPTLEQQEARVLAIIGGQILPVAWERDLRAAAATIRRHAELVRLIRACEQSEVGQFPQRYAAIVAAIGKEP
jgi:hypothetical protein